MAGKPIATIGSMHICPMCSGTNAITQAILDLFRHIKITCTDLVLVLAIPH